MKLAKKLRSHFFFVAVAVGLVLAWVLSPLDWFDGYFLFVIGSVAGDWNRQLNPVVDNIEGPELPWDDMYASERLSYFIPALATAIFGIVFLMMAVHSLRVSMDWASVGIGIFMIALGAGQAYWKWAHRYS